MKHNGGPSTEGAARTVPSPIQRWQTAGFGLYIHWPFCESKCPYCDFNSHVSEQIDQNAWLNGYLSEMRKSAKETEGRVLRSIFFGGGTPSLMRPDLVEAIIDEAGRLWTLSNDIEITLEANPSSVEIGRFRDFKGAGVNRVSVGVQALNNTDLRRLGRMHDAQEARAAIKVSQAVFDRTNFDLIYARQDQSLSAWRAELKEALNIAEDHMSLYQLTVEPGTVFGARFSRGLLRGLPNEDLAADMYELTQEMCEASDRPAYEVSNHSRVGGESRHNIIYWQCGDYIGVGPGAHGRLTDATGQRFATVQTSAPAQWLHQTNLASSSKSEREILSAEEQATEFLVMGLRLTKGVDLADYNGLAETPLSTIRTDYLQEQGLIELYNGNLRATPSGRLVLNYVLQKLTSD